jgi:erythromycin esterase-like protein
VAERAFWDRRDAGRALAGLVDHYRQSHYFRAGIADQFDAVVHIDEIRAVEPIERTARWDEGELPETYPYAV